MYRFSLFPTANLQIQDLSIALLSYICAKQSSSMFVVRVEDTDKTKYIEGKEQEILDILALCGISYDHLYYQSNHFKYHLQFASFLMDKGLAFACFCGEIAGKYDGKCINISQEELLNNNLPFVIRLKKPKSTLAFEDTRQGELCFEPEDVDSFVIMTKNKYPTHNFACACDDMLQGITHILCHQNDIAGTAQQEHIRKSLGYEQKMAYAHLPALHSDAKESDVKWLLDEGFMPEAIINYLILLAYPAPTEIFTLEEAMKWFELKAISSDSAHFDIEKLRAINREHIKKVSDMELSKRMGYACESIGKLAKLYTQEVSTTYEIKQKIDAIFAPKSLHVKFEKESELLKSLIQNAPYCENFDTFKAYLLEKSKLEEEVFIPCLRFLLTGCQNSPELSLLYPLLKNYLKEIVR